MRKVLCSLCLMALLGFASLTVLAQKRPQRPRPRPTPTPEAKSEEPEIPGEPKDLDIVKTDTDLVIVPVIATDKGGLYIPNLSRDEFSLSEDSVKQEIAFFAQTSAPFNVVLMLDTSASTKDKLKLIQQAAYAFVQQLQPADKVKIISFDNEVNDLNEFTSDREVLRTSINSTRSGEGTRLYDAMAKALDSIRTIKGRKAIVLFTDGVDWYSGEATFDGTLRWLDEEGVIVYPIRYDTRATTERIAREQADQINPQLPTIGVLHPNPGGVTPPTFPGGDPIPTTSTRSKTGPFGLPSAEEILRRRREQDPNRDPSRAPSPDQFPDPPMTGRRPDPSVGTIRRAPRQEDSITSMLDLAYATADQYLETLANKSGGKLMRADTLGALPDAFARIAAELRTQYSLGYYPLNKERDEHYRKIKVMTTRKDVVIRARPGYLATAAR